MVDRPLRARTRVGGRRGWRGRTRRRCDPRPARSGTEASCPTGPGATQQPRPERRPVHACESRECDTLKRVLETTQARTSRRVLSCMACSVLVVVPATHEHAHEQVSMAAMGKGQLEGRKLRNVQVRDQRSWQSSASRSHSPSSRRHRIRPRVTCHQQQPITQGSAKKHSGQGAGRGSKAG